MFKFCKRTMSVLMIVLCFMCINTMGIAKTSSFYEVGKGEPEKVSVSFERVNFEEGLKKVVPDSFSLIYYNRTAKQIKDRKITLDLDSEKWTSGLDLLSNEGFVFVVNWDKKKIYVKLAESIINKNGNFKDNIQVFNNNKKIYVGDKTKIDANKKGDLEFILAKKQVQGKQEKQDLPSPNGDKDKVAHQLSKIKKEFKEKKWKLEPGSLKDQLEIWCDEAGYDLVWDNKFDYRIDAGVTFKGSFKGAVQHTVKSLYDSGARIQADLYRKNTVLYISGGKKQ